MPRRDHEHRAGCRACGRLTQGAGDTLCRRCWTRVPPHARATYICAWRRFYAGLCTPHELEDAAHAMTRTAHHAAHHPAHHPYPD